jgi:hypothetical protein
MITQTPSMDTARPATAATLPLCKNDIDEEPWKREAVSDARQVIWLFRPTYGSILLPPDDEEDDDKEETGDPISVDANEPTFQETTWRRRWWFTNVGW